MNWGGGGGAGAGANGSNGNGGNGVEIPTQHSYQTMALLDQVQILVDGLLAAAEVVMVTPVHLETPTVTGGAGGGGRGEVKPTRHLYSAATDATANTGGGGGGKTFMTIPHQLLVMVVLVLFSSSTTHKKKWHILQE